MIIKYLDPWGFGHREVRIKRRQGRDLRIHSLLGLQRKLSNPSARRTHILRLLGLKTILDKPFGLF